MVAARAFCCESSLGSAKLRHLVGGGGGGFVYLHSCVSFESCVRPVSQ
jgi:hypothetical protein